MIGNRAFRSNVSHLERVSDFDFQRESIFKAVAKRLKKHRSKSIRDIPYVTEILITALSAYLVNNISFSESRYREGKKYNTRYELVLRLFLLSLRISTTVGRVCGETEQMTSCNVRIFLFLLSCCFRKRKILYTFILEIIREWEKKKVRRRDKEATRRPRHAALNAERNFRAEFVHTNLDSGW